MPQMGLTEVLAAMSLATDLGSGFPPEKGLRVSLAGMAVGAQADIANGELSDLFQSTLLLALGCTAFASENAGYFDDDLAFQRAMHALDVTDAASLNSFGSWAGEARAATLRARFIELAATVGPQATAAACEASRSLGAKLGLRANSIAALDHVHERWDGHGLPGLCGGEDLPLIARVMHLAEQAAIAHGTGGPRAAVATIAHRAGGHLDPALADLVLSDPEPLLAALSAADPTAAVIEAEPAPRARVSRDAIDGLAEAFGDLADLKCRFTLGHSRGVASLADGAASLSGLGDDARGRVRRAALVHDVGRTSVSTGTWERQGPLSAGELDLVRLHPYWSERVLERSGALVECAPLAGSHHERLDASGYHRRTPGAALSREARLLAAADVLHALGEARPHRPAHDLDSAARIASLEAKEGRLDPDAVAAVIEAAGGPRTRREWPADLTDREVDVLRLAARGLSNKAIAETLVISPRTVGHHLAHIYDKTGRRSRAGTALFAMEHGLLEPVGGEHR
ncbi:MAG TPA: HD domain-containing phosphohydrolase [Solirubrobacteraceae bacterium]|nr:HD domain-containing phosphohydrolase [Solirubrobacteraceae bacterium]